MIQKKKNKNEITNHSVRVTAVSNLAKQGEQQLIEITKHRSVHSIRRYLPSLIQLGSKQNHIKAVLSIKLDHYQIILQKVWVLTAIVCSIPTVTL